MKLTKVQWENCLVLAAFLEGLPSNKYDHESFTNECGTTHCALGWAGTMPHFEKQGLFLVHGRTPCYGTEAGPIGAATMMFGPGSYHAIFAPCGRYTNPRHDGSLSGVIEALKEWADEGR